MMGRPEDRLRHSAWRETLAAASAGSGAADLSLGSKWRTMARLVSGGLLWVRKTHLAHTGAKRLRVVETVALGEKRFAAVLQVDGLQFLIGGGAGNVSLLTQLPQSAAQAAAVKAGAQFDSVECSGCAS